MTQRPRANPIIILLIMIGFALRLHALDAFAFRGDEAFSSRYWAALPLADSLSQIATIEPHTALTYVLFRVWGLTVGDTEVPLRLLSVLAGTLAIALVYRFGTQIASRCVGLLAALIFCLHPFAIWHAQDARNNALWLTVSILAVWVSLRYLARPKRSSWLACMSAILLSTNIFYFEWFHVAAFGLYVLVSRRWRLGSKLGWALAAAPGLLVSTASFIILQGNLVGSGSYTGTVAGPFQLSELLTVFLPTLAFGNTLPSYMAAFALCLGVIALVGGLPALWQSRRDSALLVGCLLVFPLLALSIAANRFSIFNPRYVLPIAALFPVLGSALMLVALQRSRLLGAGILSLWVAICFIGLNAYWNDSQFRKAPDWRPLEAALSQLISPHDLVIQLAPDPAFGYYYQGSALDIALPASPQQSPDDITALLTRYDAEHQTIWLVGQTPANWPNKGIVEDWLTRERQVTRQLVAAGLRAVEYRPWAVTEAQNREGPLARYEDVVEMVDARWWLPSGDGEHLTVWLYWRPLTTTDEPLKVFVHLLGDINPATDTPLWSQDDHFPQNGRVSTSEWEAGLVYRDVYELALTGLPPGRYTLAVGLYDPITGARILTDSADSVTIGQIEIGPTKQGA